MTKLYLSRQKYRRGKHTFVVIKDVFCRDINGTVPAPASDTHEHPFCFRDEHDSPGPSLVGCLVAGFPDVRVAGCAVLSPHVLLSPQSEASAPAAQVGTGPESSSRGALCLCPQG